MNRIQLACYSLIASAFVLGGLLLVHLPERITPAARADMVARHGDVTYLTALTRTNEDSVFVIDNRSAKLLIYVPDTSRGRLELKQTLNLNTLFGTTGGRSSGGAMPQERRDR